MRPLRLAGARASLAALCAALAVSPVLAQDAPLASAEAPQTAAVPGTPARQLYERDYFAAFAPANALQMVQRVPGFAIEQVDGEVRGFGQAAGNIVINGQRPSSKSEALETMLARIPASRVQRIEVAAGDQFGAEYAGKAQVLNLVLTAGGGLAGTLEGTIRRDFMGRWLPEGSASALIRAGKSTFNLSATFGNERSSEAGDDRITSLPSGAPVEHRYKRNHIEEPNWALAASWAHDDGDNRSIHANGRLFRDWLYLSQVNRVMPVAGTARTDALEQDYFYGSWELGGDVTRPLLGGGIKLIGLATRRDRLFRDTSWVRTTPAGGSEQILDDRLAETLARLVWSRGDLGGWKVETGAEGVFNRLESQVDLSVVNGAGVLTRIDLPVDRAIVSEWRGEGFVNAGRAIGAGLRLDLGLTYETSRLTVRGDATSERSLGFWKPRMSIDWKPGSGWRTQLSVQRTVAQLRFEDFVSSAEISNDRVNGGNAGLLPQRAWEALATIERKILGDGLVKLELGHNRVQMVQDRVPTPEGFDAPGNLGDGSVWIARGRIDAPLGRLAIKGGRLTLYGSYVSSAVQDPYTVRDRPFSGNSLFYGEATFRQDLTDYAWGFTLTAGTPGTYYRRNETDRNWVQAPYVEVFAEARPDKRTTLTLTLGNATAATSNRDRLFYLPDRRTAEASSRERRVRNKYVVPALTVKRSFG
jgi:hypothetical protein